MVQEGLQIGFGVSKPLEVEAVQRRRQYIGGRRTDITFPQSGIIKQKEKISNKLNGIPTIGIKRAIKTMKEVGEVRKNPPAKSLSTAVLRAK